MREKPISEVLSAYSDEQLLAEVRRRVEESKPALPLTELPNVGDYVHVVLPNSVYVRGEVYMDKQVHKLHVQLEGVSKPIMITELHIETGRLFPGTPQGRLGAELRGKHPQVAYPKNGWYSILENARYALSQLDDDFGSAIAKPFLQEIFEQFKP